MYSHVSKQYFRWKTEMDSNWEQRNLEEENEKNIFILGLIVLFAWMFVIILCASPQLFRNFILRNFCCCWWTTIDNGSTSKEKKTLSKKIFLGATFPEFSGNTFLRQMMLRAAADEDQKNDGNQHIKRTPSICSTSTILTNITLQNQKSYNQSVFIQIDDPLKKNSTSTKDNNNKQQKDIKCSENVGP